MIIKGIIDECFNDYKKPSMYIAFPTCSFKCDKLNNCPVCQNSSLMHEPDIDISKEELIQRYLDNPITSAFVLSGLEPFDSIMELYPFIVSVRDKFHCDDDIVIYTGYTEQELLEGHYGNNSHPAETMAELYKYICKYPNIYIKFGRFIMNDEVHEDGVLGVTLASYNQYGKKVSNESNSN